MEITPYIAFDTETTGLNTQTDMPFYVVACNMKGETRIWDYRYKNKTFFWKDEDYFRSIWKNPDIKKVFFNAKYDLKILENINIPAPPPEQIEDAMLMAYSVYEYQAGWSLDYLGEKYCREGKYISPELEKWKRDNRDDIKGHGYRNMPTSLLEPYALRDVRLTLKLYFALRGALKKFGGETNYEFEKRFMYTLISAERTGLRIDAKYGLEALGWLTDELRKEEDFLRCKGIGNFRSPAQVKSGLERLGFILDSTNRKTLQGIKDPSGTIPRLIRARKLSSTATRVVLPILKAIRKPKFRLHPTFNQIFAVTGRLSSSDPNLQNLNRPECDISQIPRSLVRATPGWSLEGADYDQMEMRIIAEESGDPELIRIFEEFDRGHSPENDVYISIARLIWPGEEIDKKKRYIAKQTTIGTSYGMGPKRGVEQFSQYGVYVSFQEVASVIYRVHERFPYIKARLDELAAELRNNGYVTDRFGRRYNVPEDLAYKALNAIIQGTAAGVTKRAWMNLREREFKLNIYRHQFHILNCIHDEFLCERLEEYPQEAAQKHIIEAMESVNEYFPKVPLTASIKHFGDNWASAA